jgi:hypothetical protein
MHTSDSHRMAQRREMDMMDQDASENPMAEEKVAAEEKASDPPLTRADVDRARADVADGKMTDREYADLVDRFYTAELAQLRTDIETPFIEGPGRMMTPSKMEHAIMGVVAHMTEAPTCARGLAVSFRRPALSANPAPRCRRRNWHQATVYALATDDPADAALSSRSTKMLVVSMLIVVIQSVTVAGVLGGTLYSSCASNDQCAQQGQFCGLGGRLPSPDSNCWYCGTCACPLLARSPPC